MQRVSEVQQQARGPFTDLAAALFAWQMQNEGHGSLQQAAAPALHSKVLQFDPSLGQCGAFVFVDAQPGNPNAPGRAKVAAAGATQSPLEATSRAHDAAPAASGPEAAQVPSALPAPAESQGACSPETVAIPGAVVSAALRSAPSSPHAHHQSTDGRQRAAAAIVAAGLPLRGGGPGGIVLRAAAAASAGCTHEDVRAAALMPSESEGGSAWDGSATTRSHVQG